MTAIPAGYEVDWYRVPLPPGRLEELNRRSDLLGLLQAGGHLALILATGAASAWAALGHHWWWLAAFLYLHGTVCSFLINGMHEMVHGTVFRSRWLNEVFVHIFSFLGWLNHRQFWASHSEHHKYTLHFPYDQENVLPIRYTLSGFLWEAVVNLRQLHLPFATWHVRMARGRLQGEWELHLLDGQQRRFAVIAWARWLVAGHLAIAAVSLWYGLWIIPVVVSLTPLYGKALIYLLNNTQHVGMQGNAKDFRLNCRTIEVNPLFRFLYWHMNYHIEHHMYAAVPCYRLRELHQAIAHELPPTPQGLVDTWAHIIGVLWRQREEPGWEFQPAIPGRDQAPAKAGARVVRAAAPAVRGTLRTVWQCSICGFIYDEALGLPQEGIAPGTAWAAIPADWKCPDCGIAKADFAMVELTRPALAAVAVGTDPVVIVGSGMAAYAVARELRQLDREQRVVVVTRDDGEAYAKPALSNAFAHGRSPGGVVTRRAPELASDLGIEIRTRCAVSAIDRVARRVVTAAGPVPYRHLVLALGADPIRVPIAGDAAERVLSVNDLADYRVFRQRLPAGGAVLVIGGGLIGCEFADDLLAGGHAVRVVDLASDPLAALAPPAVGARLRAALVARGVAWHAGTSVVRVDADGQRLRATLADGSVCQADVVLSAVGLRPRTALAREAGLAVGRGITVDARLATSDPAISALGDCAEIEGRLLPFILPMTHCARAVAAGLAGSPEAVRFPVLPIVVKTPSFPIVIVRPPPGVADWQIEAAADGVIARAYDAGGALRGLALGGGAVARKDALLAEIGRAAVTTATAG